MIPATQTAMQTSIENPVIYIIPMWHTTIVRIMDNAKDTILVKRPQAMKAPAAIIVMEMPGMTRSDASKACV